MIKRISVWDLDLTVIDSSHRQCFLPDGNLDLAHWRDNCTPEQIRKDRLLPLADVMREQYAAPSTVVVVLTSRVLSPADYHYLADHGLYSDLLMGRIHESINTPCGAMKGSQLLYLARHFGLEPCQLSRFTVYDDQPAVLDMARRLGCKVVDSVEANEALINGEEAVFYND